MWLRLRKVEGEKKVSPFLLFENPRILSSLQEPQIPFSSSDTPDFLSTCLGIDSLSHKESDTTEQLNWTDTHRKNLGSDLGFSPKFTCFLHINVQLFQHYLLKKKLKLLYCFALAFLSKISWPYLCGAISMHSILFCRFTGFPTGLVVKNLSVMQEMQET